MNEKVFTAWFPQCCAPTLITRSAADITAFAAEHGKIVVKPLDGMGGKSIFVTEKGDKNLPVIIETLTDYGQRFAIAQRYVPDIASTGDSRVLLIDGRASPLRACPNPGCRTTTAAISPPAPRAWAASSTNAIAGWPRKSARRSREQGMVFVGIDVIGGFVTEINVTSPTGIRELDKQFGLNIGDMVIAALERRIGAKKA